MYVVEMLFVFFSSRRRHTRYWRVWSSDVCSSDLRLGRERGLDHGAGRRAALPEPRLPRGQGGGRKHDPGAQIGRAAWRERVEISVVAGSLKKKNRSGDVCHHWT